MTLLINKHTFEVIDYDDKSRITIIKNTNEWLKIPEGAIAAVRLVNTDPEYVGDILFISEQGKTYNHRTGDEWLYGTFLSASEYVNDGDELVWERDKEPKSKPTITTGWDLAAVPETIYHYAASYNTHRGTTYYDGVVSFPGRITGIEDYHKVRAQIAEDGHVTADRVNVHSLTVIG